mmetsp:Transcript_6609/g.17786  ORF Transcript_6609/g.17786 Transcript_6609/m.17786 type:complete len:107 (+) Transcript_6609:241-561(+)
MGEAELSPAVVFAVTLLVLVVGSAALFARFGVERVLGTFAAAVQGFFAVLFSLYEVACPSFSGSGHLTYARAMRVPYSQTTRNADRAHANHARRRRGKSWSPFSPS